ncbi:MAG TPA: hypothetical protein VEV85_17465 [Bryobacteraceae bacterium]|nr:hypothetical protein [Bryobacteraceae bacterium]
MVTRTPLLGYFEVGRDSEGDHYHLITAWKATGQEEEAYAKNV